MEPAQKVCINATNISFPELVSDCRCDRCFSQTPVFGNCAVIAVLDARIIGVYFFAWQVPGSRGTASPHNPDRILLRIVSTPCRAWLGQNIEPTIRRKLWGILGQELHLKIARHMDRRSWLSLYAFGQQLQQLRLGCSHCETRQEH